MNAILEACLEKARKILSSHRDQLESLTNELVRKETLGDAEVRALLGFPPLAADRHNAGAPSENI